MIQATSLSPVADPVAEPLTPEWYAARYTGIGASEAAAACGMSQWAQPLSVYLLKRREISEPEETDAMRMGKLLEPVICAEFVTRTGIAITHAPVPMYRHRALPFMFATADGLLETDETLECKATTWRMAAKFGDVDTDAVPEDWILQCHQQMFVYGRPTARMSVLFDGRTLKTYRVPKNSELIDLIIEAESELWERIQTGRPPEPDWAHPRTPDLIRQLYGEGVENKVVALSEQATEWWMQYQKYGRIAGLIDKRRKMLKARVEHEVGDAFAGVLLGGEKMIRRKRIVSEVKASMRDYVDVREVNVPRGLKI